jgi:hypothetical protein
MSDEEDSSASQMTVKQAVQQVRREAVRLRAVRTVLEQVQAAIPAPSPEELAAMAKGERPVSPEAHLLGVLQAAIVELENVEEDLRYAVSTKALSRLDKHWQRGDLPNELDLRRMRAALSARNA